MNSWLLVALASLIGGSIVPGLGTAARLVVFSGLMMVTAFLEFSLGTNSRRVASRILHRIWLCARSLAGRDTLWHLRLEPGDAVLSAVGNYHGHCGTWGWRFGYFSLGDEQLPAWAVTLIVIAVGLKLAHWGYYVPEWNYRYSQGPWGRAIGQWVPKKWVVYTLHDWQPDLAFFIKHPVRQLPSPYYLEYEGGPESKFVLLQDSEFENWPESAPPVKLVAKFLDQSARERVLARTAGPLPPPLGPNPLEIQHPRANSVAFD